MVAKVSRSGTSKAAISAPIRQSLLKNINSDAFVSTADPSARAYSGATDPKNCLFWNLGRNALHGRNFAWSDFYITKSFAKACYGDRVWRVTAFQLRLEF